MGARREADTPGKTSGGMMVDTPMTRRLSLPQASGGSQVQKVH
jgi:hypothetical protein